MFRRRVTFPPDLVAGRNTFPPDLWDVVTGVFAVSADDTGRVSDDVRRILDRFWGELWPTLVRRCAPSWMIRTGVVGTVASNPVLVAPPRVGPLSWFAGLDRRRAAGLFEMWRQRCEHGMPLQSLFPIGRAEAAHLVCWERHAELLCNSAAAQTPRLVAFTLSESEIIALDRLVYRGTSTKVGLVNVFPFRRSGETYVGAVPAVLADGHQHRNDWTVVELDDLDWRVAPFRQVPAVSDRDWDRMRFVAGALSGTGSSIQELWDLSDDLF